MILPRFSLRFILGLITASACFFLLVRWSMRGSAELVAVVLPVVFLALLLVVHILLFFGAWMLANVFGLLKSPPQPQSPFATDRLPEQIIRPHDPD